MTMKVLTHVKLIREARKQKTFFDIIGVVCTDKLFSENATSRHCNFTILYKIINIDVRN